MKTKIPHLILATGVMLFMLPGTASAQTTFTWDGGGGDGEVSGGGGGGAAVVVVVAAAVVVVVVVVAARSQVEPVLERSATRRG